MAYIRRRGCKCADKKKCKCGAKWSFTMEGGRDPLTGERTQITRSGFARKDEAEAAAAAMLLEIKAGSLIKETDLKFKDYVEEWFSAYSKNERIKVSTIDVKRYGINRLTPFFAHLKIKNISRKVYQSALDTLKEQGASDQTVISIHATGKVIFKSALIDRLIKVDPTVHTRVNRTRKTAEEIESEYSKVKYLEKEELALFLKTASESGRYHDYPLFLTLAYSGMRGGELCALKWKDVNFDECTLNITKTLYTASNRAEEFELLTPKTRNSRREITLEKIVIEELQKLKHNQNLLKMKFRATYRDQDFVFVRKSASFVGLPLNVQCIGGRMSHLLKISRLNETLTPHSLRHTHTSLLAEAGAGLAEIMDRLGHKDDATTRNIYLHITKTLKKETSRMFGDLMKNI